MNKKELFIQQIIETVLYFREMYEENNDGKTSAIELLKPVKSKSGIFFDIIHVILKLKSLQI